MCKRRLHTCERGLESLGLESLQRGLHMGQGALAMRDGKDDGKDVCKTGLDMGERDGRD